ncbi:LamG domain-containing protein, partial [Salmonella sp. s54412]|uniref:LamG domain-containing protein n=1 Tax=Salmonella sp. s54412 TaxID=3160128 RepID=UPI0037553D45
MKKGNTGHLFTMYNSQDNDFLALSLNPVTLEYDGGKIDFKINLKEDEWHMLGISIDGDSVELLVDCDSKNRFRRKNLVIQRDGFTTAG